MSIIKLHSSDGEEILVDYEIAKVSTVIKNMVDASGLENSEPIVVPLFNVKAAILKLIIEWATKHKDDPPVDAANDGDDDDVDSEESVKGAHEISTWDTDFLNSLDQNALFNLIIAANFLKAKKLLNMCCKYVANMTKEKSTDEIWTSFNALSDFASYEEYIVAKYNTMCLKDL